MNSIVCIRLVLISTYWNVNLLDNEGTLLEYEGFNLNLLECKLRNGSLSGIAKGF